MVLSMDRWKNKVAVVTGACGAVGGAVVKQLVEEGLQVVGVDIKCQQVPTNERFRSFAIDITKEEPVVDFFQKITNEMGPIHILVNCAGIVQQTNLIDGDVEMWQKVFDTNVLGLCIMTREAVKIMKENHIDGHIIHIGSISGHCIPNVPDMNVYPATKSAVRALTETLRLEMIRLELKIKVTCISPGKLTSLMAVNNGFVLSKEIVEMFKTMPMLEPSDVADAILYALSTPPRVQVHEMVIRPVGEMF